MPNTFKLGDKEYPATPGLRDAYAEVATVIKANGGNPPESVTTALAQLEKLDLGTTLKSAKPRAPGT